MSSLSAGVPVCMSRRLMVLYHTVTAALNHIK